MDWERVLDMRRRGVSLYTEERKSFRIALVSGRILTVDDFKGNRYDVTVSNLEKAEDLLRKGVVISGPEEYRLKVADEHSTFAWAILRELGDLG